MTNRPDILIDARLLAYRRGGISRYVDQITRWMPIVAPDLSIAQFENRDSGLDKFASERVMTPPHNRYERLALGAELSLRRPRLVHSPDFIAPITPFARRIISVHDLHFLEHPEHLDKGSRRYYSLIYRSLAAADAVIAVSRHTARQLFDRTRVEPSKVVTILNGVDLTRPLPTIEDARVLLRRRLPGDVFARLLSDRPMVLSVGTIEPRKRQWLLLDAMHHLRESALRPLLLLAGQPGWECDDITTRIHDESRHDDVVWLDAVDDELLDALYAAAAIVAIPSMDEGFGLTMLEGMRAGAPVIASNRGALPEVASGAALLVDSDDAEQWSTEIAKLLSDEDRLVALRESGTRRAQELSWERTARLTADIYREVLQR